MWCKLWGSESDVFLTKYRIIYRRYGSVNLLGLPFSRDPHVYLSKFLFQQRKICAAGLMWINCHLEGFADGPHAAMLEARRIDKKSSDMFPLIEDISEL